MQATFPCPECGESFTVRCKQQRDLALRILEKMERHGERSPACGQALWGAGRTRRARNSLRAGALSSRGGPSVQASPVERTLGLGHL